MQTKQRASKLPASRGISLISYIGVIAVLANEGKLPPSSRRSCHSLTLVLRMIAWLSCRDVNLCASTSARQHFIANIDFEQWYSIKVYETADAKSQRDWPPNQHNRQKITGGCRRHCIIVHYINDRICTLLICGFGAPVCDAEPQNACRVRMIFSICQPRLSC